MPEAASTNLTVTYDRIVVPLDGSELAERALPHAVSLASGIRRPVHLIRVIDITPLTLVSPIGLGAEQAAWIAALNGLEAEEEIARDYLKDIKRRIFESGVTVTWEVDRGLVAETLIERVKSSDLLTMTTHGRTGLSRWFFGSVAEELLRRSTAPVLLIRTPKQDGTKGEQDNDKRPASR